MVDIRDFSNTAIALLIIIVLASVATVHAVTTTVPKQIESAPVIVPQLDIDSNMAFNMFPQDVHVRVGDTFVVTVAVENVTDMYGWQVYLRFNPAMVECTGASLPPNNVFCNSVTVTGALTGYNAKEFPPGPLCAIKNDEGWVLTGDCLLGADQPTFKGSGVLCQVEFRALSSGSTTLALLHDFTHTFQTYTLTFDLVAKTAPSAYYSNIYIASN
jgi:hypothetical protein